MEQEGLFVDLRADSAPMERGFRRAADAADQMTRVVESRTRRINEVCDRLNTTAVTALRSVAAQITGIGAVMAGGALTVDRIIKQADAWKSTANQIALVTQGTSDLRNTQDALFTTAQKARQSYGSVVDLYSRGAKAANELGASQDQLRRFTEGASLAAAVGGKSAQEQAGAIQQLGQLLFSARVQAEEYNSVLDGAPRIAQAVADGLDGARGSVGRLKQMVDSGQVSNRDFFAAFLSQIPKIEAEFGRLKPTIAEAGTVFDNALGRLIGRADESVGATTMVARAIIDFSGDLESAAKIAGVAGGTLATVLVARGLGPLVPALAQGTASVAAMVAQWLMAEVAIKRGTDATQAFLGFTPDVRRAAQITAAATLETVRAEQAAAVARVASATAARDQAEQLAKAAAAQRAAAAAQYEMAQGITAATGRQQVAAKALSEQNASTAALIAHQRQLRAADAELSAAIAVKAVADERAAAASIVHETAMRRATLTARAQAVALTILKGALALVGGPLGATVLAIGGAFAFFALRSTEAEKATEAFTAAQQAARDATKDAAIGVDALAKQYSQLSDSMKAVTALKLEEALQKQRDAIAAQRRAVDAALYASSDSPIRVVQSNNGDLTQPEVLAYERMGFAAAQVERLNAAFAAYRDAAKDDPQAIAALVSVLESVSREAGAAGGKLREFAATRLSDPADQAQTASGAIGNLAARLALLKNPADQAARAVLDTGSVAEVTASRFASLDSATGSLASKLADLGTKTRMLQLPAGYERRLAEVVGLPPELPAGSFAVGNAQDRKFDRTYQTYSASRDVADVTLRRQASAEVGDRTKEVERQVLANRLLAGSLDDASKAQAQNRIELSKAALEYPDLGAATAATILTSKDFGAALKTLPPELQKLWTQMSAGSAAQLGGEFAQLARQSNLNVASSLTLAAAYGQGAEAVERANRQIEIETQLLKLGEGARAGVTAMVNAEADARQRLELAKWVDDTDRQIAAAHRLAQAEAAGGEAIAEANTQNKVAEELDRQRIGTGTKEAGVIDAKVRALEKENQARRAAAELRTATDDLATARAELSIAQTSDAAARAAGERALVTLRNQQQAARLSADIGQEAAQRWLALQEQIADASAMKAYADSVRQTADTIATDWAETLFDAMTLKDKNASILDGIKALLRRIALEFLKTQIVMPVAMQVVGTAPSLFGIQAPSAGAAASQNGGGMVGGTGNLLSLGSKLMPSSWTGGIGNSIATGINQVGYSMGIGGTAFTSGALSGSITGMGAAGLGSATGGAASAAGVAAVPGGLTNAAVSGAGSGLAPAMAGGASLMSYLGPIGGGFAAGGLIGPMVANGNKAVGGLAGAASGAAAGALIGSVIPGIGTLVGALIGGASGGLGGLIGTQKPSVGKTASADVTIGASGLASYGNILTDNKGDPAAGQALGQAVAAIFNAAASGGGSLTKSYGFGQTEKGGYFIGGSVDMKEFGDDFAAMMRYALIDQGGLTGGGANTLTAIRNSQNKDAGEFGKDIALGASIDAGSTALAELDKTLAGVEKAAKKAAGASYQSAIEEKKRADTLDLGNEYARLAADSIRSSFSLSTLTPLKTSIATTEGQFAALADAVHAMGLAISDAEIATWKAAATEKLLTDYREQYDASMRAAQGLSVVDQALAARKRWEASWQDDLAAGRSPNDLYAAQLKNLLQGIDDLSVLNAAAAALQTLDEVASAFARARADEVRTAALADLTQRLRAAQVTLGQVTQEDYDRTQLEITQAKELAGVTDEAVRARLLEVQAAEKQALTAKQLAAATQELTQRQQAALQAGGNIRKWLDQRAGTASASVSPAEAQQAAQAAFARDLSLARGGDTDALGRITDSADRLLAATDAVSASGPEYQAMARWVTASLESLPATKSYDQQILEALRALGGSVNVQVELTTFRTITEQLSALSEADKAKLTQTAVILRTVEERVGQFLSPADLAHLVDSEIVTRDVQQSLGRNLTADERAGLVTGGPVLRQVEQQIGRQLTAGEVTSLVQGGTVARTVEQAIGRDLTTDERAGLVTAATVIRSVEQVLGRSLSTSEQAQIILPGSVSRTIGQVVDPATGATLITGGSVSRTVTQAVETTETLQVSRSIDDKLSSILSEIKAQMVAANTNLGTINKSILDKGVASNPLTVTSLFKGGAGMSFATGGRIYGPGTDTSDSIPARVSRDEYVIRAASARAAGYDVMDALNEGNLSLAAYLLSRASQVPGGSSATFDNRVSVPRTLIDAPAAVAASVDVQPVVTAISALTRTVHGLRGDIADLGRADHSQRADLAAHAGRKLDILTDGIDRIARRMKG